MILKFTTLLATNQNNQIDCSTRGHTADIAKLHSFDLKNLNLLKNTIIKIIWIALLVTCLICGVASIVSIIIVYVYEKGFNKFGAHFIKRYPRIMVIRPKNSPADFDIRTDCIIRNLDCSSYLNYYKKL